MADAKVRFEGQEVALAEDLASDDTKLRAALVTAWPSISTAEISRTREDGVLVVSCARKAGTKGGTDEVASRLAEAPETVNPAVLLAADLRLRERRGQLTPAALVREASRIRAAIAGGEADQERVRKVVDRLAQLRGQPSIACPVGL
ncbi:MAG: hypothetical protein U0166_29205 [Acidobacteriota bacterium]